jgi:hypothetical protein
MTNDLRALLSAGRFAEAEAVVRGTLAKAPGQAASHDTLGVCLFHQGRLSESVDAYRRALALDNGRGSTWYNLGTALSDLGEMPQAIEAYRNALAREPRNESAAYNLSRVLLLLGDWEEGFRLYEARGRKAVPLYANLDFERWKGEPPGHYVLLLTTEQGIGDAIQFARFAPALRRVGHQVLLWTDRNLVKLLKQIPDVGEVAAGGRIRIVGMPVKWSPLMSVPALIGTTPVKNIPRAPYLRADAARVARSAERLGENGFKVGLVWQGNPAHPRDLWRSIPLAMLAPLADVPGVRLISLQKQPGDAQIAHTALGGRIELVLDAADTSAEALLETAAIVANLDLVITVDTMLAHLAGAMGKTVWLALDTVPDWRWLLGRADTPWYAGMRLFRQRAAGDWAPVVRELAYALSKIARASSPPRPGI